MPRYAGACHCKAVRFEIAAEIDHVRSCDCSVCSKRGALIFRVTPEYFRLLTPLEELAVYRWGTETAADYFCRTCGILPFRKPSALTAAEIAKGAEPFDGWAVNVRCLDGFDLASVPVRLICGSALAIYTGSSSVSQ